MLSIVSVISVNLIATIASPRTDSARIVATGGDTHASSSLTVERRVLDTAKRYLGTRYRMGGTKPSAFDCSGFVRYVFAKHGVALPRTAREQSAVGPSNSGRSRLVARGRPAVLPHLARPCEPRGDVRGQRTHHPRERGQPAGSL